MTYKALDILFKYFYTRKTYRPIFHWIVLTTNVYSAYILLLYNITAYLITPKPKPIYICIQTQNNLEFLYIINRFTL